MIEIPEAQNLARQFEEALTGKVITRVVAAATPHRFAWYWGNPEDYASMLAGKAITGAAVFGSRPELWVEDMRISFADGVNLRFYPSADKAPAKHQLLLEFDTGEVLCCTVQMYGGLFAFPDGANDDFYYVVAQEKPSPLSAEFDALYFAGLLTDKTNKLSAKAFLATEQRIPGLGNGVLQDILWRAKIHPKRKMNTLSDQEFENLFQAVKALLAEMTAQGGRDTEKDLYGNPGRYLTVMSKNNAGLPCPGCGTSIRRFSYLGGNVYVCDKCQTIEA